MTHNNKIFLSIIIPCYNIANYIEKGIDSLHALPDNIPIEFIFINDGSKDDTLQLIRQFQEKDSRVIVIDQPNQGVSAARNAALDIAKGKYILFMDGDDFISPDSINFITENLHNTDLLIADVYIENNDGTNYTFGAKINGTFSPEQFYKTITNFPVASKLVYRNDIIQNNKLRFDATIKAGEIYEFTLRFLEHAQSISATSQTFYHYVMREDSAIHHPNFNNDKTIIQVLQNTTALPDVHNLKQQPSFYLTLFRLATSFIYNKYAKAKLTDDIALQTIKQLFDAPVFQQCLKKVSKSRRLSSYKLQAFYMRILPPLFGYKLLCKFL